MQSWLLNDRLRPRRDEDTYLFSLHELSVDLNQSLDPGVIMQRTVEWVAEIGVGAAILEADADDAPLQVGATGGLTARAVDTLRAARLLPREDTLVGQALKLRRAVIVAQAAQAEPFADVYPYAQDGAFEAAMAIPLVADRPGAAVLLVYASAPGDLSTTTTGMLELLAQQVAVALSNAHASAELRARATQIERQYQHLRRAYDLVAGERRTLAAVLDSAADAVLVTDHQGIVRLGNQAVESALGIHPDLLIGKSLECAPVPERLALLIREAHTRGTHRKGELELADGRTFHISVAPVETFDWPIQTYVTLFKDVTYFKRLDDLKSQFVATVSHDMKSPLNIINSYTEMLELAGPLNQEQTTYVDRIMGSVQQLTSLVNDLLDLARIEAHVGIQMAPCDLGLLVRAVIDDHLLLADEKRINLVVRVDDALPMVRGDEGRLRQVVSNLLANALTYTPRDGTVWLSVGQAVDGVIVRIEDSGIGINSGDIQHIFDPFFRTDSAQAVNSKGTGLGLAIAKRIVEEHGGEIGVESAINGGSTFWFSMPLNRPPHEQQAH